MIDLIEHNPRNISQLMFNGCVFEKTSYKAILFSLPQRTYREVLPWKALSIATHDLVGEGTVKGQPNHWSNTPLRNCMLGFALGMLILSTLQNLSGQNFNAEPEGVLLCLWKSSASLLCTSMCLGLSTKLLVTI